MLIKCGSCFNNCCWVNNFVNLLITKLRLPEDGAEALKHVGVLINYFNMYVYAFVGINNKQCKIHGTYIEIFVYVLCIVHCSIVIQHKTTKCTYSKLIF